MDDQLGLFGDEPLRLLFVPRALRSGCKPKSYSLFFALRPSAADLPRCGEYVAELCGRHERAVAAGAHLSDSGSISLQLDRLKSFANHSACVLGCTADSHRRVITVRDHLRKLLKQREIKAASVSLPHMTAYYDPACMPRDIVVETLSCVAHCLSLILSHKGCTEHETIAEWSLG